MSASIHAALVIAICAGVTLLTRALPFVCFGGKRGVPRLVTALGKALPSAIMAAKASSCSGCPVTVRPSWRLTAIWWSMN